MKTDNRKKVNINVTVGSVSLLILPVFLCLCICFISCNPKSTEIDPEESFSKIYDRSDAITYTSVDIKQTMDEGYIILGKNVEHEPYLLKVDKNGDYMWDIDYNEYSKDYDYKDPISDLLIMKQGQREEYYFFCNEEWNSRGRGSRVVVLIKASENQNQPVEVPLPDGPQNAFRNNFMFRPFHASITSDTSILLVGVDEQSRETLVVQMKIDDIDVKEVSYKRERYYDPCITLFTLQNKRNHLSGTFKTMGYDYIYYQSFSNETYGEKAYPVCLGIRILAPTDIKPFEDNFLKKPLFLKCHFIEMELDGTDWESSNWDDLRVSGVRKEKEIIVFYVNFKISDFKKKEMDEEGGIFQPELIDSKRVYVKDTASGILQPELNDSKRVYVKGMNVNEKKVIFFAGSTRSNQIVLYAYNRSNREFLNKIYFGHTHTYEAAGLIETIDGGLAILGTTYFAGRLGRICLFKLSKAELEDMVR